MLALLANEGRTKSVADVTCRLGKGNCEAVFLAKTIHWQAMLSKILRLQHIAAPARKVLFVIFKSSIRI